MEQVSQFDEKILNGFHTTQIIRKYKVNFI